MRLRLHRPRRWRPFLLWGAIFASAMMAGVVAQGDPLPSGRDVFADPENETTKAELEAEDALLQAIGEASPAPVPDDPENAGPPLDPEDFEFETGIALDPDFPDTALDLTSSWGGVIDGWNVTVYAGSRVEQEGSAFLLVKLSDPATAGSKFEGPFQSAIRGPLTIVSAKGSLLTLVGGSGDEVVFDAKSRTFLTTDV